MSFNCRTNGNSILFYIPNIIERSEALSIFASDTTSLCTNAAKGVACKVRDIDNTTFAATLTVFVPLDQNLGQYTVVCRASDNLGERNPSETSFFVTGEDFLQTLMQFPQALVIEVHVLITMTKFSTVFNALNTNIVAANFSCSVKFVFVK